MHSYLYCPSPMIGFFASGLSSAMIIGAEATNAAAPAALINVLRDVVLFRWFMFVPLPQNDRDLSDATNSTQNHTQTQRRMVEVPRHSLRSAYNSLKSSPGGGTGRRTTLRW